jgi:hypothetical protein
MEEILELKQLLLKGDFSGSLAIVEELEEMGRKDIIKTIRSYAIIFIEIGITACSKKMWYIFLRPSPSLGRRRFRVRVLCLVTVEQAVLHLIKQQAEKRTTRSWDVSIGNSI